ncbi:hypothetical protein SynMEDNS5_01255 [Synechococcus sp. MEDNS5]|uniref:hypothetical protein n=1 Tax=Synechococcus sp. MEDNS5 TaxID=1442554 RepID=UPI001648F06D|nr:hypothetical protein [Synechococcus sp. MEDNS5]QNJ05979.1 hypothetical protein SynMEDNS5_01255 [Synechococcus sp. MEDNS5]|tara:strand:+ start:144 stop:1238 length:1095 start_codon:yes stop_codon:yes gene_type:complete
MLIYVCISSHGFGHAARQAALLRELHLLCPHWTLVISTMVDRRFLELVFRDIPVVLRPVRWDVGMLQADALGADPAATLEALKDLEDALPQRLDQEVAWISKQDMPVLVIGDIPPVAAELAEQLQAPLVWMGNFGWDDIYAPLGSAFAAWVRRARDCYQRGSLLLRCPFSLAMNWNLREISLTLVAAEPRSIPAALEAKLQESPSPNVLVGFGGLGLGLEPSLFARWPDHRFLLTLPRNPDLKERLALISNVTLLPDGVRPLDVMPYCRRHLGKPGFSSFCEAMAADLGLHVVERQGFAEASVLMEGLRQHASHRILRREELESGRWALDQPLQPPTHGRLSATGAIEAAKAVKRVAIDTVQQV